MKLRVRYSERVYYYDDITFTDEQIKEMLIEVGVPKNEREELFSDLDKLFDIVKNSQTFHDYLSQDLTFRMVDADDFQYDHIGLK